MANMKRIAVVLAALALIVVGFGCEREVTGDVQVIQAASTSCFDCHSDQDIRLTVAEFQWEQSVHASGENTNRNRLYSSFYQACEQCHTHQGFIAKVTDLDVDFSNFTPIHCFTCHAPHSNGTLQLRVEGPVSLENGFSFNRQEANLCASCHHSRADAASFVTDDVELSTHWGPHHSVQADMLMGTNAYEYAGYSYRSSAHQSIPEGCIHCHMSASEHMSIGGHSWNMHNEERGFENITGCNGNEEFACHNGAVDQLNWSHDIDGDGDDEFVQDVIDANVDTLGTLLTNAGLLTDGEPTDGLVVSTADSAGAIFNYLFVHEDRSEGIHNTDYAMGLLRSSINFMRTGDPNGVGPTASVTEPNSHMISSH